jgi:hypothetical protein
LCEQLHAESTTSVGPQVSFHDLARAPALARAARAELYDRQHSGVIETGGGEANEFAAHAAEVERQHAAWLAVDTDAKQEARVNKVTTQSNWPVKASKQTDTSTKLLETPIASPQLT